MAPCRLLSIVPVFADFAFIFSPPAPASESAARVTVHGGPALTFVAQYCPRRKHCNYSNVVRRRTHFGSSNFIARDRDRPRRSRGGEPSSSPRSDLALRTRCGSVEPLETVECDATVKTCKAKLLPPDHTYETVRIR